MAMRVVVPVTMLSPCSKEFSHYRATHQQDMSQSRCGHKNRQCWAWIWIEELVEIAERSASAPVYALLKRPMSAM